MASGQPIDNRIFVLILQHSQEKKEALAKAASIRALLSRAELVVGLSWPNLSRALGRSADSKRWAMLYLVDKIIRMYPQPASVSADFGAEPRVPNVRFAPLGSARPAAQARERRLAATNL
jgi:hypothetical protein